LDERIAELLPEVERLRKVPVLVLGLGLHPQVSRWMGRAGLMDASGYQWL